MHRLTTCTVTASLAAIGLMFPGVAAQASGLPGLPFVADGGPERPNLAFRTETSAGSVFVTRDGAVTYMLPARSNASNAAGVALVERIVGGCIGEMRGLDRSHVNVSYIDSSNANRRSGDQATYERVSLGQVYPGIECTLRTADGAVEKVFTAAPGADAAQIRLSLDGAEALRVDARGRLVARTALGRAVFSEPIAYQDVGGRRCFVEVAYAVDGAEYGFKLGAYDHARPLIIDPLLAASYLGGAGDEGRGFSGSIALAPDGSVYVAGTTQSADLPAAPGAYDDTYAGGTDVVVARFNADLSQLLAVTYFGGVGQDGYDRSSPRVVVNDAGEVYLACQTKSDALPASGGAFDPYYNGDYDIFVACFDADLTAVSHATYLGSPGDDWITDLSLASDGDVVLTGHTRADGFPTTPGAYSSTYSGHDGWYFGGDAVIVRLDPTLSTLVASTYLGGTGYEFDVNLSIAPDGTYYVSGTCSSRDFPITPGAYDSEHATTTAGHQADTFVAHMSEDLTTLLASTYIGGGRDDWSNAILVDPAGFVYVGGHSCSRNTFPVTPGAYDETYNGPAGVDVANDVVVSKFNSDLTQLLAATFIGGYDWEMTMDLACDANGYIYVAGHGRSAEGAGDEYPTTPGAFDPENNGDGGGLWIGDGFISRLDPDLSFMSVSTFFGGSGADALTDMALAENGDVYFVGYSDSTDLPMTPHAYADACGGGQDLYVAKLDKMLCACPADFNGDRIVNLSDLAHLLGSYGSAPAAYADGDLDGDGDVDLSDLAALLGRYGDACE